MQTHQSFISRLTKPHILSRIRNKIRSFFFLDQWIVLLAPSTGHKFLSWNDFKPLVPPLDRFWADPFIWVRDNIYYIFIEELIYSTKRGHIVCLILDKEMNILSNQVVLERPYHLSYPFLFEYEGQLYMIPETGENKGIELYRCVQFPDQWEFEKNLISNVCAYDATLVEAQGKWWLFANIKEDGGSTWDTLHLYYADHPLSDQWTPHPRNPIVKDIHSARPAGHIFLHEGKLIRPSQDCSVRYGYATNFNCIITLTETDYAEDCEHIFKPLEKGSVLATHTFNRVGSLTAIDAIQRRRKK
jgi:hypothetical protein